MLILISVRGLRWRGSILRRCLKGKIIKMKVKSTKALRYFIKTQKGGDFDRRTDSDFIGSYHGSPAKGIKGFFKIFHGIKENIPGYLQPILKIAEDGQAVYEFIQNAVDCDSTQFWIFYNDEYFLAINNGDSFRQNEIASILNIAQSDKKNLNDSERCDKIGRFGIGFKLVHRLVGESDGSTELTNIENGMLKGPVLFSWSHYSQLNSLVHSSDFFEQVEFNKENPEDYRKSPWLFKILLTNFPVSPGELVKDFSYNPFTPLPISEVNEFKNYLKLCLGESLSNKALLSKGSIFFIKLGRGKAERLRKEALQLENGVNYSMHFFNKLQKITINESIITKKPMEWLSYEIKRNDVEFIDINPEYLFCPIKISVGFAKEDNKIVLIKSQPNFYKYFPLGDETNKLGLIVHSDAFDIESNRRKLHTSSKNEKLINAITKRIIETLNLLVKANDERYRYLFLSILLSESSQTQSNENTLNFINPLKVFIKNNVVTDCGYTKAKNVKIKAFKFPLELQDVGFENYQWFGWNELSFKEACHAAISELGIEKWALRHVLSSTTAQNITTFLKSLKLDAYIKFVEELKSEDIIKSLKEKLLEVSWLHTKGGNLVTVQTVIDGEVFLIKDISTEGASIFHKISKDIISPELNFAYSYIADIAGPIETSTKTISDFLCQPETGLLIKSLTFEERTYLNGLVNKTDERIMFLPLFKSKKHGGSLMPLNSLISNTCKDLPIWLNDFVINAEEETALSAIFQDQLLKEKDLLEKLFCNLDIYNEIITNISSENISEFYTYLLKLNKTKPKGTNIDSSKIPWVFIESNSEFALASSVYWPESITSLSTSKYSSVKSILETITNEKLPHQTALQIKAPFALGGKDLKLTEITPNQNSFDVIPVNDFLDWAETIGEKDLLNHFSFSKIDDNFSIGKVSGTSTYYTKDETLIKFIESSISDTKLSLFPKQLYTKERNKIGLLGGVSLLKHLLENGLSTPALAKYIQAANDISLSLQYLEMLTKLNIESSKSYTIEDAEFKILKLVVQHLVDDDVKLALFKKKIFLDTHSLAEKAFSDDVRFYKQGFATVEIKTKLKEILPAYQNHTYSISEVISKFIDFRDDPKLIKIFKSDSRPPSKIYKELNELKPLYFSPTQTFFLSYYKMLNPSEDVFKDKVLFTNANSDNQTQLLTDTHQFLDICIKENSYTGFIAHGIFSSFKPENLVSAEEYAIASEKLPSWLSEWINKSDTENKKEYIKLLGINNEDSPVVQYRKAIKQAQPEPMNVNRELIDNNQLLYNTLIYLSDQQKQANLVLKKEVLQPLYQKLQNRKISANILLFPSLISFQLDSYSLDRIVNGEELHYINDGWGEYKNAIFSILVKAKKITDEVLPKAYRDELKVIEKTVVKSLEIEKIKANSNIFDEEYYQNWNLKSQYNIQIYKGIKLPYLIKYNDILINTIYDKYADYIGDVYYVVESKKESILFYLEGILPDAALNALKLHKQNLIEKEKEAEKKIQFTEEESAIWKKLFGNEIPEEYYQDINLAACVSALVVLEKTGYDVSKAEVNLSNTHLFAQITPVYKNDTNEELTIMCRSAIGGILYLTAQAWERLGSNDIHLFVKTGQKENNYHLFHEKNDVLEISDTKYQVFRVEASSNSLTTDKILRGEFAKDKIWLILKMKENEKYKLIFEGGIKRNEENPDYDNVNTSENSNY